MIALKNKAYGIRKTDPRNGGWYEATKFWSVNWSAHHHLNKVNASKTENNFWEVLNMVKQRFADIKEPGRNC